MLHDAYLALMLKVDRKDVVGFEQNPLVVLPFCKKIHDEIYQPLGTPIFQDAVMVKKPRP